MLTELEGRLHKPIPVLSLVWLILVIYKVTAGNSAVRETVGTTLWIAFLGELLLRLDLAPAKRRFPLRN